MEKRNEGIVESLKNKIGSGEKAKSDEARPVKWVRIGTNIWRIVYAD
ncbi:MAG: hypothetical protein KGH57_03915 [Candidatus Micrarchaeota archaeon]|nr:hypothetical protein [Candidatus Micrarchaeota archaeon]